MSLQKLSLMTYEVRHNPNCPSPFEVRVCGGSAMIDHLPTRAMFGMPATKNIVGYGKTADEAAKSVLKQLNDN